MGLPALPMRRILNCKSNGVHAPASKLRKLPALPARRRKVVRTIDPHPIFWSLAQPLPSRIHQKVTGFFFQFVMIPQAVIEKIALPLHAMFSRNELLPIVDGRLHSWFTWDGNDRVQMIRHQQTQTTVPDEPLVIELHGGEHSVPGIGSVQLILAAGDAVDSDKEPTAVGHPLRNCVRQLLADRQVHVPSLAKTLTRAQTQKVGRAVPCAPKVRRPREWSPYQNASPTLRGHISA